VQKYCEPCSIEKQRARQAKWQRTYGKPPNKALVTARRERVRATAGAASIGVAGGIGWNPADVVPLLWRVEVGIPYSEAISKNAVHQLDHRGHIFLRRKSSQMRNAIAIAVKAAIGGRRVVTNKIWLDILIEKATHKSDAVNSVDTVCDAVKMAIPVDDRWYAIRRLDWRVVKTNPMIVVGIGQDSDVDSQVCSMCGGVKPLEAFNRNRANKKTGRNRECSMCRISERSLESQTRRAALPPPRNALSGQAQLFASDAAPLSASNAMLPLRRRVATPAVYRPTKE